jgi:cytochrome P450
LLPIPRYAREDVLHGTVIRKREPVTAAIAAANRDPRAFAEPEPDQHGGV